jgi:hypothetical protein
MEVMEKVLAELKACENEIEESIKSNKSNKSNQLKTPSQNNESHNLFKTEVISLFLSIF